MNLLRKQSEKFPKLKFFLEKNKLKMLNFWFEVNARCCLRQQKNNFFFHAGCLFMFNIQSHCYCLGVFFKPKCLRFNSNVFLQCIELYQVNSQIAAIHHSNTCWICASFLSFISALSNIPSLLLLFLNFYFIR